MRLVVVALLLISCAPRVDGPVEQQRAVDRDDADRLAKQLAQLPGAVRAEVTLHRPVRDPLGTTPAQSASAAILVVIDDQADREAITAATRRLLAGTAPEIAAASVIVEVGATRPALAKLGPFTIEASTKRPLAITLAIALAAIAVLAGYIAWRERSAS